MSKEDKYIIFHVNGSPDKDLVGTSVVNSIKEENPDKKIVVITHFPEIWLHNPDVYRVYKHGATPYFYEEFVKEKNSTVYALDPYLTEDYIQKKKHLAEIWCDMIGVEYNGSKPQLFFTQREEEVAMRITTPPNGEKLAFIQPFEPYGAPGIVNSWTKDLPINTAQKIVNEMRSKGYTVIQIKAPSQPQLAGTSPVNLNLRLLMAAIKFSDKNLFIDSFGMQVATALNKPSVVTWLSTIPKLKGYDMHTDVFANVDTQLKNKLDEYSAIFDITNQLAAQDLSKEGIDLEKAYDVEEIIKALDL